MAPQQYSPNQILLGLRSFLKDEVGADTSFNLETNVIQYFHDPELAEVDLADVLESMEEFFGFKCGLAEWEELFHFELAQSNPALWRQSIVPTVTFGKLAEFIAQRAPVTTSFAPMMVLGNRCATAGIFMGLMQTASRVVRVEKRFAPHTPIRDVLKGRKLDKFWTHLRWMTENNIPELPASWRFACHSVGLSVLAFILVLFILLVLVKVFANPWLPMAAPVFAIVVYLYGKMYLDWVNPLPTSIVTFRDLAMLIDENRKANINP
ncbi:MAG: hypothetical protein JNJ77_04625 [Planctomycetia bacterium]|nr:hypothetical protein [Planctomycetia bacterium]